MTSARLLLLVGLLQFGLASIAYAHEATDAWDVTVTPYLWVPGIDASAKIPPSADLPGEPTFPITKSEVLGALNFAFMGSFEARKGNWSLFGDFNYADLSFSKQAPTNLVIKGKVDFTQTFFDLAAVRRFWASADGSHFDVLFGGRYIDVKNDITLTLAERQFKFSADKDLLDAILGIKGEARLGEDGRWFIPYYGDIGGGSSDHSWLVSAGVGYAFGWGDLSLSYREFEFDPGKSSPLEKVRMYGPVLAFALHF